MWECPNCGWMGKLEMGKKTCLKCGRWLNNGCNDNYEAEDKKESYAKWKRKREEKEE